MASNDNKNFDWYLKANVNPTASLQNSLSAGLATVSPYKLSQPLSAQYQKAVVSKRQQTLKRFHFAVGKSALT